MGPTTSYMLAKLKLEEELRWAERQRLARIARGANEPDAVAFTGRLRETGRRLLAGFGTSPRTAAGDA